MQMARTEPSINSVIINGRSNCIGILSFCGEHLVGPAQLSCLGLLQLTEMVFTHVLHAGAARRPSTCHC